MRHGFLQAALDFYNLESLDDVAGVDVVVTLQAAAAFHAGGYFLGLVFSSLQGGKRLTSFLHADSFQHEHTQNC